MNRLKFLLVYISSFSSGFSDVMFSPIFLSYLIKLNVSAWGIAAVTVLEYLPRLFGPFLIKILGGKRNDFIIKFSSIGRFFCYIIIFIVFIFIEKEPSNNSLILVVVAINLFSDFLGTIYFLNQTIINRVNFDEDDISKLTSGLFVSSNLSIFLAYFLAPQLEILLPIKFIALINAIIFLIPLIQIFFIKKHTIDGVIKNIKFSHLLHGDKTILYAISLTFLLNLMIGNPNFIITQYSKEFNINTITTISIFSSSYLLGSLIPNVIFSVFKNKINFKHSISISYFILSCLFISFLFPRGVSSVLIYLLTGISIGILQPSLNNIIYLNSDNTNVSYYFSINSFINSLGTVLSPLIVQTILFLIGYKHTMYVISTYYFILILVVLISYKYKRTK